MFTGIIEQQGQIIENQSERLIISSPFDDLIEGESIAVNGVCLTVLPSQSGEVRFDVSPETLSVTALGCLKRGDWVNLERAMQASTRFGGHYVSGHVDTQAEVYSFKPMDEFFHVTLGGFKASQAAYLLPKGSITVDGVSLTINAVEKDTIQLMLVPHTLKQTTLNLLSVGQKVNIEFDYLTRIIAHQLQVYGKLNDEVLV